MSSNTRSFFPLFTYVLLVGEPPLKCWRTLILKFWKVELTLTSRCCGGAVVCTTPCTDAFPLPGVISAHAQCSHLNWAKSDLLVNSALIYTRHIKKEKGSFAHYLSAARSRSYKVLLSKEETRSNQMTPDTLLSVPPFFVSSPCLRNNAFGNRYVYALIK